MNPRALVLLVTMLATQHAGCSSDDPDISFDAKAGETCRDCDVCKSTTSSCECRTCTMRARDNDAKVLLSCVSGVWQVRRKCPGGVTVSCTSSGAYNISCLDENGAPVPY